MLASLTFAAMDGYKLSTGEASMASNILDKPARSARPICSTRHPASRCPKHFLQARPPQINQARWSSLSSRRLRPLSRPQEPRCQQRHRPVLGELPPTLLRSTGHSGVAKSGRNGLGSSAILAAKTRGLGGSNMGTALRTIPPCARAIS